MSIETILSAHTHTHTQTHTGTHTHEHMLIIQSIIYTQLKVGSKQRFEMDEDNSLEQKTWQVYSLGKRNILRFDLNESRDGFCGRGRGRSFHVEGLKTEKAWEPTVETGARTLKG